MVSQRHFPTDQQHHGWNTNVCLSPLLSSFLYLYLILTMSSLFVCLSICLGCHHHIHRLLRSYLLIFDFRDWAPELKQDFLNGMAGLDIPIFEREPSTSLSARSYLLEIYSRYSITFTLHKYQFSKLEKAVCKQIPPFLSL